MLGEFREKDMPLGGNMNKHFLEEGALTHVRP